MFIADRNYFRTWDGRIVAELPEGIDGTPYLSRGAAISDEEAKLVGLPLPKPTDDESDETGNPVPVPVSPIPPPAPAEAELPEPEAHDDYAPDQEYQLKEVQNGIDSSPSDAS